MKHFNRMQQTRLKDLLANKSVFSCFEAIKSFGGSSRLVGGCVRDSLLGEIEIESCDIDIATDLEPKKVSQALNNSGIKTIPTGIKHGTITALPFSRPIEITTLRKDLKCDGRHAQVQFSQEWKEDASRRDFTFNAIYSDLSANLQDYFDGVNDLKLKRLRFVGDPIKRIQEDYLRILRAFRFQNKICKEPLDQEIKHAILKNADKLQSISSERIQSEMMKLLKTKNPFPSLEDMIECGVFKVVFGQTLKIPKSLAKITTSPEAKIALILRFNNKKQLSTEICKKWKLSKQQSQSLQLCTNYDVQDLHNTNQTSIIHHYGEDRYTKILQIATLEEHISLEEYNNKLKNLESHKHIKFPISGNDLMKIGYIPGKGIGHILEKLKNIWYTSNCTMQKQELLKTLNNK